MGTANSDNASNNQMLDSFFGVFDPASGTYGPNNITPVLINNVFCPNDNANNPTVPGVGITDHGPNFIGVAEVTKLFTQLFTSFPDLALTQVPNSAGRLYSRDGQPTTIGIRATFSGTFTQPWFLKDRTKKDKDSHYSKPLSDIPVFANSLLSTTIPAFVVFVFGGNAAYPTYVSQVSIYLDRYMFIADLTQLSDGTIHRVQKLEELAKRSK